MFATISLNQELNKGIPISETGRKNFSHHYDLGKKEWQQDWKSLKQRDYSAKEMKDNRVTLDKPYLKQNYSNFEYIHFPNKEPFLTSNKRDFKTHKINENNHNNKEFISASRIVLGDHKEKINSTYADLHNNPKDQKSKYNYNKVEFKYNPNNVHPITSELISKKEHKIWAFDYYNKDKVKNYVSNDKPMALNTNFKKIYDPITNRYLN